VPALLASIPSPADPFVFQLGRFDVRWYGLLLAIGVLMAGWIAQHEFARRGVDPELAYPIAVWVVPCGLVGARLYHVVTDWHRFSGHLERLPEIWTGGLGIYGAVLGGAVGAYIAGRRVGFPFWTLLDCIVPGVIAAQAIGRFGNYFNQELYGGPTSLPWGLEISPANRPAGYEQTATFHPTFLYESLWDFVTFVVLLLVARTMWRRLAGGAIFALYLCLYSFGRFWVEGLRIDPAHELGPLRLNQVVAAVVFVLAGYAFWRLKQRGGPPPLPPAGEDRVPVPQAELADAA
jgi:phosphatidylglycerol---prolipoprotein diacylglyceryl transferase